MNFSYAVIGGPEVEHALIVFAFVAVCGASLLYKGLTRQVPKDVWGLQAASNFWYVIAGSGLIAIAIGFVVFLWFQGFFHQFIPSK